MDSRRPLVYLTGFMGSGKTAVAPKLARLLRCGYADLDSEIERRCGLTVREIFRRHGEARFREVERGALKELSGMASGVIALGGGTLLDPENLALVKTSGTLVYLRVEPGLLLERLGTAEGRPLLEGGGDIRGKIGRLLSEREPGYEQADHTVTPSPADDGAAATARAIAAVLARTPPR